REPIILAFTFNNLIIFVVLAIFLASLSHALSTLPSSSGSRDQWSTALREALSALQRHTPAQPGDRTLMDALHPFITTLGGAEDSLAEAVKACKEGMERTRGMKPRLGRSVYIGESREEEDRRNHVPDPGAMAV